MAVRIVVDSTADIPKEQADALGITIVPLTVFFGDEAYLDGIDLDNATFFHKMEASKELPRTSQPSPALFQEAYTRLINAGADSILSVQLSSKLSGTYQSACTARDTLANEGNTVPIEVVDSLSISIGVSSAVLQAVREAREGLSLAEIKAHALDQISRTRILAVLDTLDYVRRGGRIGLASALLGNMLSFKPIISLKDGGVIPLERPRTRSKAYERVAQLLSEMGTLERVVIAQSNEEVGQQLAQALKSVYPKSITTYGLGATLGTHTGPGTVAIAATTAK